MLIELAIVLMLIMANGVLSGAEIAVVSLRRTRIQALVETGNTGAKRWPSCVGTRNGSWRQCKSGSP